MLNLSPMFVIIPFAYGPLAQLAEQLTFNQLVEGSSPPWPTNQKGVFGCLFLFIPPDITLL